MDPYLSIISILSICYEREIQRIPWKVSFNSGSNSQWVGFERSSRDVFHFNAYIEYKIRNNIIEETEEIFLTERLIQGVFTTNSRNRSRLKLKLLQKKHINMNFIRTIQIDIWIHVVRTRPKWANT